MKFFLCCGLVLAADALRVPAEGARPEQFVPAGWKIE